MAPGLEGEKDLDGSGKPSADASRLRAFNLNSYIRVKLDEHGYQRKADLYNETAGRILGKKTAEDYKANADEDGYTKFQAWSFMRDFGPTILMGFQPFFSTTILIDEKDLETPQASASEAEPSQSPSPKGKD